MTSLAARPVATSTETGNPNADYLDAQLERLRLLLSRRVNWLRSHWQRDDLRDFRHTLVTDAQADDILASEEEKDRAWGTDGGPEAQRLTEAIATASARATAAAETARPPLELLAGLCELSPFEKDLLVLCLAPEIDPSFLRLYAYVQDDARATHATLQLALSLFVSDPAERRRARDGWLPWAPLRRLRLVQGGGSSEPRPSLVQPLWLDERMVDYLRGFNHLDERLLGMLRPTPAPLLAPEHEAIAALVTRCLARGDGTVVNLLGASARGARDVAAAACRTLGTRLFALDLGRFATESPTRRGELCALLGREAALLAAAYLVDATEAAGDATYQASVRELTESLGAILIVVSRAPLEAETPVSVFAVPPPDRAAQRELWHAVLSAWPHSLNGEIDALTQQFDLAGAAIVSAVAAARERAGLRAPGSPVTADDLWQSCREQSGQALGDLARRIDPCFTWTDIVVPEEVLAQLRELASQVELRGHVYERWGFGAQLSRGRGVTALFAGASGTGKTMAAEIIARHLRLDLYRIDLAGVVSKYIGETEKNLRRVFDAGERSGAILLFDEADALFGTRTEVRDSHDRYANIEVNYLLQRMEDYAGLAILATNRKAALDAAFLRRLRFTVEFPFPDADSRRAIWRQVFPARAQVDSLDHGFLARLEISGGHIRAIAINAAFLAAAQGAPIGMAHVLRAAGREYGKLGKPIGAAEFGSYLGLAKP